MGIMLSKIRQCVKQDVKDGESDNQHPRQSSKNRFSHLVRRDNRSEEKELLSRATSSTEIITQDIQIWDGRDHLPFALHKAVTRRDLNTIRRLLSTDLNCSTELNLHGESALHIACQNGLIEIVRELLSLGCDPNMCTGVGTPVHSVIQGMKQGNLTEEEGIGLVELFLQRGCDVTLSNAEDIMHKTIVLCAAEYGSARCMELLIQAGASVNTTDLNNFSPLYMSAIRGDLACVQLLLSQTPKTINVDVQDNTGRTPLIAAMITIINSLTYDRLSSDLYNTNCAGDEMLVLNRFNRIAIVEALLEAGANPNIIDNYGRNALVLAFMILEFELAHNGDTSFYQRYLHYKNTEFLPDFRYSTENALSSPDSPKMESDFTLLVRLLVNYGAKLPSGDNNEIYAFHKPPVWMQELLNEVQDIWKNKLVEKPNRLMHLSRMTLRSQLAKCKNLHNVLQLPLPKKLKDYLLFKYF